MNESQNMQSENQRPRLPAVGEFVRHHGKLKAIETVHPPPPPPPPPEVDFIFEEIHARGEVRFKGKVFKEFSTWNDFYGLETSVANCLEEVKAYAARNGITPDSELEVVVVKISTHFRARPLERENLYTPNFVDFEPLERGAHRNVPAPVETVVWSSKISL